jgi:hypothetical protein
MSASPECKKCGDYIHHGPVLCESCSGGFVELATVSATDLLNELEKRIDPSKAEYDPGAITVHAFQHGEEGVIVKYVPYGQMGLDKKPETLQYGIYNARVIVVIEEES